MRKLIFGLITLIPILMSCSEEEDKVISTDLSIEASQLFNISKVWNESLYFAMISWENYQLDSLRLPSCPVVTVDVNNKEVTLNFLAGTTCNQETDFGRRGKLIITYDHTSSSQNRSWKMEYQDYFFDTHSIKGIRIFTRDDSLQVSENLSEIIHKTDKDVRANFEGKFIHSMDYEGDSLTSITSMGRLVGKNAAGRDFEMTLDTPIIHNISCYRQNLILPFSGRENWAVSRKGSSEASYIVTYESQFEDCKVFANAILPDGRKLLMNPDGD